MALLLVPTTLAAALTRVDGQAGHRSVTPTAMADLEPTYRHAAGVLDLDLSRLQLPAGPTPLHVSMGAGKIDVTVPWDADVETHASVGAGSFDLFGNRQTGVNLKGKTHSTGQPGAPVLVITGRAGAGEIVVRRGFEPFTHEALRYGQPVPLKCSPTGSTTMRCTPADGVTQTPALGCVVQAYRTDAYDDLRALIEWSSATLRQERLQQIGDRQRCRCHASLKTRNSRVASRVPGYFF